MKQLLIIQAKPNPIGKDRILNFIPSPQLAGEWVDFKNSGSEGYVLENIKLDHIAYTSKYPNGVWDEVMGFAGILGVNKIIRIHSGGKMPLENLAPIDMVGADYHLFTGKSYIWNNDKKDSPRLVLKQNGKVYEIDKASYSADPLEGKILIRNLDTLV
ncbi:hypothetical protein GW755_02065 [bacterium]|nr:hypothetical protein [bacterium]